MSSDTPGSDVPAAGGAPGWHIVEFVPLPPGRALPAPATVEAAHWDDPDDVAECDDEDDALTGAQPRAEAQRTDRPHPASATHRPEGRFGGPAPTTRPLLADLDQLLTRAADHRGATGQVMHVERIAAAEQREARRKSRRTTALRLVLLATLVAVAVLAVLAYLAFGTHLPHLTLRLPA